MSEMVERVARALADYADAGPWEGGLLAERGREAFRTQARAAIEAMREPTEAMSWAGYESRIANDYRENIDPLVWQAMIDAALK